jgi:hypothetical protein
MIIDLNDMKKLNVLGRLHAHNHGPRPDLVIRLFESKPKIWRAHLCPFGQYGATHYTIPTLIAQERGGSYITDGDLKSTIGILGAHFYAADALKIQAGQEFGGRLRNIPPLIFLWWD